MVSVWRYCDNPKTALIAPNGGAIRIASVPHHGAIVVFTATAGGLRFEIFSAEFCR